MKRTCKEICKKFRVTKPSGKGRYESDQARCQICDIWIDRRGAHTKDGSPATVQSEGWFCNCCNYRIRRNPRNLKYKAKLKSVRSQNEDGIDLSYFNKRRALMIKKIIAHIPKNRKDFNMQNLLHAYVSGSDIDISVTEKEFNADIDEIINLAYVTDPPNKISLIVGFERIKSQIGRVPTKQDIEKHTNLRIIQYEKEFKTWGNFLDRLGYDPWYRNDSKNKNSRSNESINEITDTIQSSVQKNNDKNLSDKDLEEIKTSISNILKSDPKMLELFNILDQNITNYDKEILEKLSMQIED